MGAFHKCCPPNGALGYGLAWTISNETLLARLIFIPFGLSDLVREEKGGAMGASRETVK